MAFVRTSWLLTLLVAMASTFIAPLSADEEEPAYPIIVSTADELAELGFSLVAASDKPEVNAWRGKACESHSLPPRPTLIAMSDDIVEAYAEHGFTRETLCLALYSAALFDPYSGERLPTFVFRDDAGIERVVAGRDPETVDDTELIEAGVLTDELPLAVPVCFKNGTPHRDCEWRFSERKGRQRSEGAIARFKAAGEALDRIMKEAFASAGGGSSIPAGFASGSTFQGVPAGFRLPEASFKTIMSGSPLAYQWFELGAHLPGGYAYAIPPYENERRPTLSVAAMKQKLSGKKPLSQVSAARIKEAMRRSRG